ncbi:MAG: integrin alpha, partial [Pseudomonadales bacterium]|nr:integrin alpha [Pseudomonadales bacterium]
YADGQRSATDGFGGGGALRVDLGGDDNSDVEGMSGGWQQSFTLTEETNVTLTFRYNLTQAAHYENDEFSQVLVSLNGGLIGSGGNDFIAQITGNGNGGGERSTGWQVVELDLGPLGPGEHSLVLGGFNNKKTLANESTEILFDDVLLTAEGTASPDPGPILELSSLDGANGFVIAGIDGRDYSGHSISAAGDINGDGFEDVIIGAPGGSILSAGTSGESYVIFGRASGFGSMLQLSSLDGSNGFTLAGRDGVELTGRSVSSAGDVNGDSFADLIIGAPDNVFSPSDNRGESYVVFGRASGFGSMIGLSSLDGSNGFVVPGIDDGDTSGASVSDAGDVNGDGFDDVIIGAFGADVFAGESYVIFGRASGFGSILDLSSLDGGNGFRLAGIDGSGGGFLGDRSGGKVSGAGDVNGDGLADIIIGASNADFGAGESYLVFGQASG